MFTKGRLQKNLKKRCLEEETTSEEMTETKETLEQVQTVSVLDKRRKILGKTPVRATTQKNEKKERIIKTTFESDRSLGLGSDQKATATADYDVDTSRDHRAVLERNEAIGKAILSGELEEGIYRGMGAHRPVVNKREGAIAAGKYTGTYGPVRGNQHVRLTMRIDLNPEICKDYKETGYCGFGDTCIFLHDRSDYKSGWQLEKEWEQQQKIKQAKDARKLERHSRKLQREAEGTEEYSESDTTSNDDDDDDEKTIPFACLICHEKWVSESNPVVTPCHHYFCERCALKHYSSSAKCAVCGEPTNGIFNSASKILDKQKS